MSVQQLADELAKSQPLVSHHLKILRKAGLVSARRAGRALRRALIPSTLADRSR
jgi:ArsR family transcriptional regulator, zinc-responsive transcriptional repressor